MNERLTRGGLYPVNDHAPEAFAMSVDDRRNVRAQWDGSARRMIQPGEWYLSGARIGAYRHGGTGEVGPFHPATLVVAVPVIRHDVRPLPRVPVSADALARSVV